MPPYYDLDFVVKLSFGMIEEKFEDEYKLSSYLIKPFIEMVAVLIKENSLLNIGGKYRSCILRTLFLLNRWITIFGERRKGRIEV